MPYIIRVYKCDKKNIEEIDEKTYDNVAFNPEMTTEAITCINRSITNTDISETTVIISGRPGDICQSFKNNIVDGLNSFYCNEGIESFFVESYWIERDRLDELYKGEKNEHRIKIFMSNYIQNIKEFLFSVLNPGDSEKNLINSYFDSNFSPGLNYIVEQVYASFNKEYLKKFILFISPFEMENLKKQIVNIPFPNLYLIEIFWQNISFLQNEISQIYQEEFNHLFDSFDFIMNVQMMNDMIQKMQNYEFESENEKKQYLKEISMEVLGLIQRKYKEIDENNRKGER